MDKSDIKEIAMLYGIGIAAMAAFVGTCGGLKYWIEKPSATAQVKIDEANKLFPRAYKKAAGSDGVLSVSEEQELITSLGIEGLVLRDNDVVTLQCGKVESLEGIGAGIPYVKITNPGVTYTGRHGDYLDKKFYKFDIQKLKAYVGDEK